MNFRSSQYYSISMMSYWHIPTILEKSKGYSVTVWQRSIRDSQGNHKAERIDKQVSLNAACLLEYIHTMVATKCDGFDRLTVSRAAALASGLRPSAWRALV